MKSLLVLCLFLAPTAHATVESGWRALVENRFSAARTLFQGVKGIDPLAEIGWFLTFTGNGPTEALQEAALSILTHDARSDASEFVLKWMESHKDCLTSWSRQLRPLFSNLELDNPELMVFAANNLRMASREFVEEPAFEAIAANAGFITRFKVSPRFGAYPIPAFEQSWPAEHASFWLQADAQKSRTGVFRPPRLAQGPGAFYALGSFDNPVEQEVTIRIFSYQNISLYVDGQLWDTFKHLEELGSKIHFVRGKLGSGQHELLVKSSQTRTDNGQFSIQVTAPRKPTFQAPEAAQFDLAGRHEQTTRVNVGLMASLEERDSQMSQLVRAFLHLHNKDSQSALLLLEPLSKAYPKSILIGGSIARVFISQVGFLPQDVQFGAAYQRLSELATEGPEGNLENLLTLALLLNKAQQKKPALELIEGVVKANPQFCDALEARLLFARQDGLSDVGRQTLEIMEEMGNDHRWSQMKLLEEARREGDLVRTREHLGNLAQLLPWEGYLAQLKELDEDYQAAIDDLSKRWDVFDDRDFYPYAISRAYAKLGDRVAQREWLEKTLVVNPRKREAILKLVNLDCFEGYPERASARLTDYLQLDPGDAFFRQRLSHLEGRIAFEEFRVDTAKVIEEAKNKPISEGADSELLLDQLMVRLFPDGSQMRYTHLVTRVLTKKGVDSESELTLPKNLEILELRTIKKDGSVYYPADIEHKSSVSLSGIGVGDFIDEEHIEYLGPAYYDRDGFDAEMTFIFQGIDSIYHHSELVLIYPDDLEVEPVLKSKNMPVEPEIMQHNGMKIVRWLTQDMPPMAVEPGMPFRTYSQPTATFYYNTSWHEIRDFYYNAIRTRMGLSKRVTDQLDIWSEQESEPLALATLVFEKVSDRIERDTNFFREATLVWETRQGNPSLLLAAMYEYLGYEVDVVFAQPEEMRHYLLDIPQPVYSYALLRMKINGNTYWVDSIQAGVPFNYVPYPYRNAKGMVMNLKADLYTTLPSGQDSSERTVSQYNFYFRQDGGVAAIGSDKFFGLAAAELADGYAALNHSEIKQRVEVGINQNYPGAVVEDISVTEDLPRGEFELHTEFNHRALAREMNGTLVLSFPLTKTMLMERFGSLPTRETPLAVHTPLYDESSITLMVPTGFEWEIQDFQVSEKSKYGSYSLSLESKSEREVLLTRTYYLMANIIQPEDYLRFQAFLHAMAEHEGFNLKATKVD